MPKASMLLGIVLQNNDTLVQLGTFNIVMTSLVIWCPLQPYLLNILCVEAVKIMLTKVYVELHRSCWKCMQVTMNNMPCFTTQGH
jgi:hypothetical protein